MFGTSIGRGGSPGGRCQKRPRCVPGGDVRDDVELLARLLERLLEGEVVVGRDDELMRRPAFSEERWESREETMQRAGLDSSLESGVELVVQRPRALHRRDVLRDAREVDRAIVGYGEGPGEMIREIPGAVQADHGHDAAGEERLHDLAFLVRGRGRVGRGEARLVPEDLRLESLELGTGLDPELVDEASASILVHLEGLGLPARAIQREHQLPPEGLPQRMVAHERLELTDDVAVPA